jgi:hypothetical protein
MKLKGQPYKVDFLGNSPKWLIRTTPYETEGERYSREFRITELPTGTLTLSTPYTDDIVWTVTSQGDQTSDAKVIYPCDTAAKVYEQLVLKVKFHYTLNQYYDVEIVQNGNVSVSLILTDRQEAETGNVTLVHSAGSYVTVYSTANGVNRTVKDGYKVLCRMETSMDGKRLSVPDLYYDDNNGTVEVDAGMLKAFFGKPDVPPVGEMTGVHFCTHAAVKAKLLFAEQYGGETKMLQQSPEVLLWNGAMEQYCRDNNLPDWLSVMGEKLYEATKPDIFGQDNGAVVNTDTETEQYLYVANFTGSSVTCPYDVVKVIDGEMVHVNESFGNSHTLTFPPMRVCRVPVGLAALGVTNTTGLTFYGIEIKLAEQKFIKRYFRVVERRWSAKTLLLQNRMNLYEIFTVASVAEASSTEGERSITAGVPGYTLNDSHSQWTARTGLRTASELALLKDALSSPYNLLLEGDYAWRIAIVPGSYTVMDEAEDLLEVSFEFEKVERMSRRPLEIDVIDAVTVINKTDDKITMR